MPIKAKYLITSCFIDYYSTKESLIITKSQHGVVNRQRKDNPQMMYFI